MPLNFIQHAGIDYPKHEAIGNAARWIIEMAKHYCHGTGLDIGCNRKEWAYPGAIPCDPAMNDTSAMDLPAGEFDYIFSSHCLEHVKENYYNVLDYWLSKVKVSGIIFLYLPHNSQTYWHPSSNRKHVHSFDGSEIGDYLSGLGHKVFVGGCDANHSFVVVCEKVGKQDVYNASNYQDEPYRKFDTVKSVTKTHQCVVCKDKFIIGSSRYSDGKQIPIDGDYLCCPNCTTFYTVKQNGELYKPNIFTTASVI